MFTGRYFFFIFFLLKAIPLLLNLQQNIVVLNLHLCQLKDVRNSIFEREITVTCSSVQLKSNKNQKIW